MKKVKKEKKRSTKIRFGYGIPPNVKAEIARHMTPLEGMIPPWCDHVTVTYNPDGERKYNALVETVEEYRYARITFNPTWLEGDEQTKRGDVRHELIHITVEPLAELASDLIRKFMPEKGPAKDLLQELVRRKVEGVVEDLNKICRK